MVFGVCWGRVFAIEGIDQWAQESGRKVGFIIKEIRGRIYSSHRVRRNDAKCWMFRGDFHGRDRMSRLFHNIVL